LHGNCDENGNYSVISKKKYRGKWTLETIQNYT
jgi:hypothetical protein